MTGVFERPEYLLLVLFALPAAGFVLYRWRKLARLAFPAFLSTDSARMPSLARSLRIRTVCFSLAWILAVCAAASPKWGTRSVPVRQEGAAVMFVLDISRSMQARDVEPDRLSYAAEYASVLADRFSNAQAGIVLTKGRGVLSIPLTSDLRAVRDVLSSASPAMLSSTGSSPAAGVLTALAAFPESLPAARIIILLTDGDETSGSLYEASREAGSSGAVLAIVGIGTQEGDEINIRPGAAVPELYTTRLREDALRQAVRTAGNGSLYVNGTDAGSALDVLALVDGAGSGAKMVYTRTEVYRYTEFLAASFAFLAAGCIAGGLVWRKRL